MNVKWNVLLDTKENENSFKSEFLEKLLQDTVKNSFENVNFSFKDEIFSISFNIDKELNEADMGYISMAFGSYLRQLMRNYNPGFVLFCGNVEKISKGKYVFNAIPEISEIEAIELIKNSIRKNTINVENLMNIFR